MSTDIDLATIRDVVPAIPAFSQKRGCNVNGYVSISQIESIWTDEYGTLIKTVSGEIWRIGHK